MAATMIMAMANAIKNSFVACALWSKSDGLVLDVLCVVMHELDHSNPRWSTKKCAQTYLLFLARHILHRFLYIKAQ
ncbi:hypothetical protein B9Z51_10515 [Limnohabitans sp. T6-5]|nr:hypothetical protein B9Z51_10515 [Limnohabitans sp. T6-5]